MLWSMTEEATSTAVTNEKKLRFQRCLLGRVSPCFSLCISVNRRVRINVSRFGDFFVTRFFLRFFGLPLCANAPSFIRGSFFMAQSFTSTPWGKTLNSFGWFEQ